MQRSGTPVAKFMKNILMDRLSKVYEVGLGFNQLQPTSLFISTIYQDTIAK